MFLLTDLTGFIVELLWDKRNKKVHCYGKSLEDRAVRCGHRLICCITFYVMQQCRVCSETGKSCGPNGALDGEGVKGADFVLYVSGVTTERCGQENIVAYAAYCQLEAELDR